MRRCLDAGMREIAIFTFSLMAREVLVN